MYATALAMACYICPSNLYLMRLTTLFVLFTLYITVSNAQVFMRPFDNAAAMGMGGATIALPGLSAGAPNDAQLGLGEKMGIWAGAAAPYTIEGWHSGNVQAMLGIGKFGGAGISAERSSADIYSEQRFRLAYGRRLTDAFLLGASADLLWVSAKEYGHRSMTTFGISLLARALPDVWIGAKIQNPFQQKLGDDPAPTVLRIGATWKPSNILQMNLEMEKDLERTAMIKGGLEYRPLPILVIRAGTRVNDVARLAFGAGIRLKNNIGFDLASEWHPSLGLTPSAMIYWRREK